MLVVVALALALLIKTFVVQAFYIPSESMENTLLTNDRVLVNKLVYHFRDIERGDIVVFSGVDSWDPEVEIEEPSNPVAAVGRWVGTAFGFVPGEKDYIKRVIGIPGDTVKCCDTEGRITVNGVPLDERSYLYPGDMPSERPFEITVPEGRLWVMGDHRSVSLDSRAHQGDPGGGTIPDGPGDRAGLRHRLAVLPHRDAAHPRDLQPGRPERRGAVTGQVPLILGCIGALRSWRARVSPVLGVGMSRTGNEMAARRNARRGAGVPADAGLTARDEDGEARQKNAGDAQTRRTARAPSGRRERSGWAESLLHRRRRRVALLLRAFVIGTFWIPSESMENTLLENDRVIINRLSGSPQRGDVVVFKGWDGQEWIKRVIAVGGDTVSAVTRSGGSGQRRAARRGSYLHPGDHASGESFEAKVPKGRLWVMGDHGSRRASGAFINDKYSGTISEEAVRAAPGRCTGRRPG